MKYVAYVTRRDKVRFSIYEIEIHEHIKGEDPQLRVPDWLSDRSKYNSGYIELHKLVLANYKAKDYATDPEYVELRKGGKWMWPIRYAHSKDLCDSVSEAKHKVIKKIIK
jgi:hypothetical protein